MLIRPVAVEDTCLVTSVFPKLHPSDNLLVNEIGGHVVLTWVVPRSEDLLPEEEPPRCVALLCSLLLGILLTLGHSVHHVVIATPQWRNLSNVEGKGEIHLISLGRDAYVWGTSGGFLDQVSGPIPCLEQVHLGSGCSSVLNMLKKGDFIVSAKTTPVYAFSFCKNHTYVYVFFFLIFWLGICLEYKVLPSPWKMRQQGESPCSFIGLVRSITYNLPCQKVRCKVKSQIGPSGWFCQPMNYRAL